MKKIAVLAGGYSSEYGISLNSAEQVIRHLDKSLYEPYLIIITRERWFWRPPEGEEVTVDRNDFSVVREGEKIFFDGVLIVIHGTPGEDGKLQSYFDLLGIPYAGCDAFVSALTFNKYACKVFLEKYHIATAASLLIRHRKGWVAPDTEGMRYPLFVKPNTSGSSFGVSKVHDPAGLTAAIRKAFEESDEVIIEEFIEGTEVSCGVLKNGHHEIVFPPTEIVTRRDFFDYEAKYTDGMAEEITPARLPEDRLEKIRETASFIYSALGCRGVVRVDFILQEHTPWFLEINTIPGLSRESIIPRQAQVAGLSMKELLNIQLEELFTLR